MKINSRLMDRPRRTFETEDAKVELTQMDELPLARIGNGEYAKDVRVKQAVPSPYGSCWILLSLLIVTVVVLGWAVVRLTSN